MVTIAELSRINEQRGSRSTSPVLPNTSDVSPNTVSSRTSPRSLERLHAKYPNDLPLKRVDKFGDFEHGFSSNLDRTFVNQPQFDGTMDSGELGYNAHGDFDRDDFHTNSDFGRDDLVVSNGNDVNMFGDSVSWKPGQPR